MASYVETERGVVELLGLINAELPLEIEPDDDGVMTLVYGTSDAAIQVMLALNEIGCVWGRDGHVVWVTGNDVAPALERAHAAHILDKDAANDAK